MLAVLRGAGRWLLRTPRRLAPLPLGLWLGVIAWLGGRPAGAPERRGWSEYLVNLAHAPLYGALALFAALALPRREGWPRLDRRGAALVLAFVLAVGLLDELHQLVAAPGRGFSALDVLTDVAGAAGVLLVAGYAGRDDATGAGLAGRLAAAAAASLGAAVLATAGP